jgi:hypothetical protein
MIHIILPVGDIDGKIGYNDADGVGIILGLVEGEYDGATVC